MESIEKNKPDPFASGCRGCATRSSCNGCTRREPRSKLQATDWLADIPVSHPGQPVEVSFKNTRVGFFANPTEIDLKIGDIVAVEAAPGHDIGRVTMTGPLVRLQMKKTGIKSDTELKKVFRIARPNDLSKFEEARAREHSTMIKARQIAEDLGLSMKIGDVEFQGDGAKAIFYYIADERVDFRKLIRILADTFKVRIEMKQIGARQEAGRIGGIGPCGRPLCCSSWMVKFNSVGTGAARLQDLSMNPQKLAGQCGKLKCCLNFEVDAYAEAQKQLPPKDIALETKDGTFYFFKPDILARTVTYSSDKNIPSNLVSIPAERIFEIIALNKQGIKVDSLSVQDEPQKPEYADILGQDSLTRFDKSKKKKKKKKLAPKDSQHKQESLQTENRQKEQEQKESGSHKPRPQKHNRDFNRRDHNRDMNRKEPNNRES